MSQRCSLLVLRFIMTHNMGLIAKVNCEIVNDGIKNRIKPPLSEMVTISMTTSQIDAPNLKQ